MLEPSADWFDFILNTMDEGIHVVDKFGVTVVYNRAASRLDGVAPAEVVGKHVLSVFPSLGQETSTLLQVLRSGRAIENQSQTYTNIKGVTVHTVNTTLPIRSGKTVIGALEIAKDLTQVKRLSDQVLALQTRVAEQGRRGGRKKSAEDLAAGYEFADIITGDDQLQDILRRAERVARTASPVLIYGETGTGKELLVQAIHTASPRAAKPFLALNCAALPASLVEGILFGSVRGSFTGAEDKQGLFELADEGTLFLDEVQALPLELQAKLLRVLESGEFFRVGDARLRKSDVRVLAALNVSPEAAIDAGQLRRDLYYRLSVIRFDLPPLRERRQDIAPLTEHFITKWNAKFGTQVTGIDEEVAALFAAYPWPGNVRELEHAIEGALNLLEEGPIGVSEIPLLIREWPNRTQLSDVGGDGHFGTSRGENSAHAGKLAQKGEASPYLSWADVLVSEGMNDFWLNLERPRSVPTAPSYATMLRAFEKTILERALQLHTGNVKQTAARLGVPRQTLQYRLKQLQTPNA